MEFTDHDLVIAVIDEKLTENLLDKVDEVGVTGSTIIPGRGRSAFSKLKFMGITVEPRRDVIIILSTRDKSKKVLNTIKDYGQLHKPGQGIVFVLEVKEAAGLRLPK